MIGLIIGFIGYLVSSTGYLGGDLIYAMDTIENWYWIVLAFSGLLSLFVLFVFTGIGAAMGHDKAGKNGAYGGTLAGFTLGTMTALLMLIRTILQLWIVTWLMSNLDPSAISFAAITTKETLAMVALFLLAFVGGSSIKKTKTIKVKE